MILTNTSCDSSEYIKKKQDFQRIFVAESLTTQYEFCNDEILPDLAMNCQRWLRLSVQGFASQAVGSAAPGFPCPPYKIIILDEAVRILVLSAWHVIVVQVTLASGPELFCPWTCFLATSSWRCYVITHVHREAVKFPYGNLQAGCWMRIACEHEWNIL